MVGRHALSLVEGGGSKSLQKCVELQSHLLWHTDSRSGREESRVECRYESEQTRAKSREIHGAEPEVRIPLPAPNAQFNFQRGATNKQVSEPQSPFRLPGRDSRRLHNVHCGLEFLRALVQAQRHNRLDEDQRGSLNFTSA